MINLFFLVLWVFSDDWLEVRYDREGKDFYLQYFVGEKKKFKVFHPKEMDVKKRVAFYS